MGDEQKPGAGEETAMAIKLCPHCSREAKLDKQQYAYPPRHWVKCTYCGACSSDYSSPSSALSAWNARASTNEDMGVGGYMLSTLGPSPAVQSEPVAWIPEDHMRNLLKGDAVYLIDAMPKKTRDYVVPLYAHLAPVQSGEDQVEAVARAVHGHLCRRDVMQYLDNPEDCDGLARAAIAAMPPTPDHSALLREMVEALEPFANAAVGVQAFDPDFPMEGAALRASFDWYDKIQSEPLKRRSVRRSDLENARTALRKAREVLG